MREFTIRRLRKLYQEPMRRLQYEEFCGDLGKASYDLGYCAFLGDEMIGGLLYQTLEQVYFLDRFCVKPAYWRQGVGSALVSKLIERMEQSRRNAIVCHVPDWRLPAQLFLVEHQFEAHLPVIPDYFPDGSDAYFMMRERDAQAKPQKWKTAEGQT